MAKFQKFRKKCIKSYEYLKINVRPAEPPQDIEYVKVEIEEPALLVKEEPLDDVLETPRLSGLSIPVTVVINKSDTLEETKAVVVSSATTAPVDHTLSRYKCEYCQKNCIGKRSLSQHVETHRQPDGTLFVPEGELRVTCDVCNMQLRKMRFIAHFQNYHQSNVECQECFKVFKNRFHLTVHNRTQHDKTIKSRTCKLCFKYFKDATDEEFAAHCANEEIHLAPCEICGRRLNQKILKKHLQKVQ